MYTYFGLYLYVRSLLYYEDTEMHRIIYARLNLEKPDIFNLFFDESQIQQNNYKIEKSKIMAEAPENTNSDLPGSLKRA